MANEKGLISKHDAVRHLRGVCIGKYPQGLCEFILKWLELTDLTRRFTDEG